MIAGDVKQSNRAAYLPHLVKVANNVSSRLAENVPRHYFIMVWPSSNTKLLA